MSKTNFILNEITVLEPVDAIRKRPAMYLGPLTDPLFPNYVLRELLADALVQSISGATRLLTVEIAADGDASISYDGPGVSVEIDTRFSALEKRDVRRGELRFTQLYAPSTFCALPKKYEQLMGVGAVAGNAMCSGLTVTTPDTDRNEWAVEFVRGTVVGPFRPTGLRTEKTTLRFTLDATLLPNRNYDFKAICDYLEKVAPPALTVLVNDYRAKTGWYRAAKA